MGMSVFEFGDAKLAAGDIDPLYNAVWNSGWSIEKISRYVLAFVAFDLAGLAALVVDGSAKRYWELMHGCVDQTRRGQPRRYYRGPAAHASLDALQSRYRTAERALYALEGSYAKHSLPEVAAHWQGWGPTAAWKIADMAERCAGVYVDFTEFTPTMMISNDMIRKGCVKACNGNDEPYVNAKLIQRMIGYRWKGQPPGSPTERPVGPQEIETILCYYSHDDRTSRHLVGMDKENIRAELNQFAVGKSAARLLEVL